MNSIRTLTEDQVFSSIKDGHPSTELSLAIAAADKRAMSGGGTITVVRTVQGSIRLYTEYQMVVAKRNIESAIYITDGGFLFQAA